MDIRTLLIRFLGGILPKQAPKPVKPTVMVITKLTDHAFQSWPETGLRSEPTIDEAVHSWHDLSEAPAVAREKLAYGLRYVQDGADWKILPPRPWSTNIFNIVRSGLFRYNWDLMRTLTP